MQTRSSVFDLARQMLRCGDAALLDSTLDRLSASLPKHDDAAELLRDLLATGIAETLRDALEDDRLDRWIAETCTQREEEQLCRLLMRWLGTGSHGDDDPARLVELAAFPDLFGPDADVRLYAWARAHEVADLLGQPALELLPMRRELNPELTLEACCLGRAASTKSLLATDTTQEEACAYLRERAAVLAAPGVRARLWQRPMQASLRSLSSRLQALLDESVEPSALAAIRFIPARPVSVDTRTGTSEGMPLDRDGVPFAVRIHLSGHEHRALASHCARCTVSMPHVCLHVQALAARLLDALHAGQRDRLHAALAHVSERPSWQRFVNALQNPDAADGGKIEFLQGQLGFRLRIEERAIGVGVLLRKPQRDAGLSAGKLVAPLKAARLRACSERDRPLLDALSLSSRSFTGQYTPANLVILRALVEHPHVAAGDSDEALRLSEQQLHIELIEQPEGLLPRVSLAGVRLQPAASNSQAGYLFRYDAELKTLWFAPLTAALRRLLSALEHFHGLLPRESFSALSSWFCDVRQVAQLTVPIELQGEELPLSRKLLLRITPNIREGIEVALSSRPLPLGALWPPGQGPSDVHGLVDGRQVFARRDLDWERLASVQALDALGLHDHPRVQPFIYRIESQQAALRILQTAAELSDSLELEWAESTRKLSLAASLRTDTLSIRVFKRVGHWLTLEGSARSSDAHVAVDRLLEAARRGERFVRVADGTYAEIAQDLFERLELAQLCVAELKPGAALKLPTAAVACWQTALGKQTVGATLEAREWLTRASAYDPSTPPPLAAAWTTILRDYQVTGARWLLHMSSWAPGACLADEMGLGKTLQAITLLDARAALGPALVLAPTSVVSNWLAELARFAPQLHVRNYSGADRARALTDLGPGCVLVSSYELLLRDSEQFAERSFATQVLDEAHLIKNARTARARAAVAVRTDFRLALSGTPIENRLGDLWSLFHGIAPGLLGDWARFRALFAVPIERYANTARADALRKLIAPFILRRTKSDVASELPERTEVVHRFALSDPERALYQAAERDIRIALSKRTLHETRTVQILAELTRLRQLACHPRLVLQQPDAESSKLAVLLRLLDDILPRGHRALLFSQFTRHLALVREALDARGLSYLYLDGSTPAGQRGALVERFQAGEAALFLISLKAGGTGLNLTAADYVIHLDPWWNPAAQDQASDRAHRLGQRRPVTVVKLVAEDTIEEKVLALHGHKRELADSIMRGNDMPAQLDMAALQGLLP